MKFSFLLIGGGLLPPHRRKYSRGKIEMKVVIITRFAKLIRQAAMLQLTTPHSPLGSVIENESRSEMQTMSSSNRLCASSLLHGHRTLPRSTRKTCRSKDFPYNNGP